MGGHALYDASIIVSYIVYQLDSYRYNTQYKEQQNCHYKAKNFMIPWVFVLIYDNKMANFR